MPSLIYVHDPMCSWCWGFRPAFEALSAALPATLERRLVLGGLAPDTDQPMPASLQRQLQDTWQRIQRRLPGTRFNFAFWDHCSPRRSTWPACRAVIAARSLNADLERPMILAIQQAYYLQARNPSDDTTLIELAVRLGLPAVPFSALLAAPATQRELDEEIAWARRIGADSFPALRPQIGDSVWPVPVDYSDPGTMLGSVEQLLGT